MNTDRGVIAGALALMFVICFAQQARASTLVVSADGTTAFQTIQSAIDAAIPNQDQIVVGCGVYHENIVMRDGVSLSGTSADCAVIDGSQSGSVVTMVNVGQTTVLERFTIQNGLGEFGGGIYMENSAAVVRGNRITGNATAPFSNGGGIFVAGSLAAAGEEAVGPVVTGNLIMNNTTDETGGGIEIFSGDGSMISNNIIANNSAGVAGGGISVLSGQHEIVNNTILGNCLQTVGQVCDLGGGGIALVGASPVDISNNAIVFNEAAFGGGGVDVTNSTVNFDSNDAFGNLPVDYAGTPDPTGLNGNLAADPLLSDEVGGFSGFQPRSHSPLIDAATSTAPAVDLRGVARPRDGDSDGLAVADIGARENEGITRVGFDADRTIVRWDPGVAGLYNLYRGDIAQLRQTQVYTQDPAVVPDARNWCGLESPMVADVDAPAEGQAFFYLAVAKGAVEGSLGLSADLTERPFTDPNRCP